jgi:predicted MFS family arabinose efflux permease
VSRAGIPGDALVLGAAQFLMLASANILTPLLPAVQREFGIDYTAAGLLVSSFAMARLSLDLPAGFLEQRLGVHRLALTGLGLALAGSVAATYGPTFQLVLVGRVLMGLGTSIVTLVVLTSLDALATPSTRARVLSLFPLSNHVAIGVFPVVGGLVGSAYGWRSTMLLCGALMCVCAVLIGRTLPRVTERRKTAAASDEASAPVLSPRLLASLGLIYLGVMIAMINRHGFRNTALPLFASDRIGLDSVAISTGIAVIAGAGLLVAIPGAVAGDRWGQRRVIMVGFLVLALGDLAFLGATTYPLFLTASLLLGLGDFFSSSQTAVLTSAVPANWRSRVLGTYRFAVDLGATIGPLLLASVLQSAGFETLVLVTVGLLLAAAGGAAVGARLARGDYSGAADLGAKPPRKDNLARE